MNLEDVTYLYDSFHIFVWPFCLVSGEPSLSPTKWNILFQSLDVSWICNDSVRVFMGSIAKGLCILTRIRKNEFQFQILKAHITRLEGIEAFGNYIFSFKGENYFYK